MIDIQIDQSTVQVPEGSTILEAARAAQIDIPTLCYLEGMAPLGACRMCVVEVEGAKNLVASCSTPVREGMKVRTNSARVRNARKMVIELLLSEHDGDCQICERGEDCELQETANRLGVRGITYDGEKPRRYLDESTPALQRDTAKCIKCRRCMEVCKSVQNVGALAAQYRGYATVIGPAFAQNLADVVCVQCGQCAAVCPVGAITERSHIPQVWEALEDPEKHVVVQTAPAIRAALGETQGYEPGTLVTGQMVTALRKLGFDGVFDTNFAADLTIMEEGTELLTRLKTVLEQNKEAPLPQYTSCSPGWIKFAEHFYPRILPNISTCKSPQQMFGAMAKSYYAEQRGIDPAKIVVVSVMPCTAKKFEAQRPEMNSSGFSDVDFVLTTRELGQMIKEAGIDFDRLAPDGMDSPLGLSSGAADIFANTGGVMEAAARTVYEIVTGRELPMENLHISPIMGLDGLKEASLKIENTLPEWSFLEGVELKTAVAHGLGNASKLIERVVSGEAEYHFIEVMTCPGGCIGGGGQPRFTTDEIRKRRIQAIYAEDEGKALRKSHENPAIKEIYEKYLGTPLGERSHHYLHTKYQPRTRV
ncbi:MAG TPA: 2Fe-2S iron-sulfur cluster binding domain-containing protein [Sediminispirochaeta sp.]|nr:2Fe-2S iron-sulfur cluster binding domain-containing protein [Sediminispirochaeta sp.]